MIGFNFPFRHMGPFIYDPSFGSILDGVNQHPHPMNFLAYGCWPPFPLTSTMGKNDPPDRKRQCYVIWLSDHFAPLNHIWSLFGWPSIVSINISFTALEIFGQQRYKPPFWHLSSLFIFSVPPKMDVSRWENTEGCLRNNWHSKCNTHTQVMTSYPLFALNK